ncbi:peptide/nickel transport system ATP-binding protein [Agromyces atrinae]|uniref:ABC transporter ATP-binding protein n=1 Tax=Agromyces atrinae TaxID=592376 RepID=A0A4Q2M680_9MICO|nr:ABC transporter ATP-binding protein [Agromyces atrinae]NYD65528.1 peptide/nickel transport system ATP-binding protein [Agromyces atrinae]RXZ85743.1 ABC transporter ATP-binding protein [Agromyces atrinae]
MSDIQHTYPAGTTPVLTVDNLCVDFGVDNAWVPAAKNLSYTIGPGEVVAVVGESGSGKSASSMAILDLLPKNSRVRGTIDVNGRSVTSMSPRALRELRGEEVAAIFQEPMTALNPVYTVGFQIVETIRTHRPMPPSEAAKKAIEMLTLVEMPDPKKAFDSYPHQLSGGQRQRAMIAQALVLDPSLLIADEPTTALDVTVQAEILELLRDLKDRLKSAVLLITHDMGVVADLADWVVVMQQGVIVEQGPAAQIFASPQDPYTQALLAAVPHLGQSDGEEVDVTETLSEVASESIAEFASAEREAAVHVTEPVLALNDVIIEYGARGKVGTFRAVDEVSLEIGRGEILGLVGESGSGKSTIGRAAIGLQPIAGGSLVVAGTDLSKHSRKIVKTLRRKVGIVFQDPSSSLNPRLPIGESIGEPLFLAGEAKGKVLDRRVEELLDSVRLPKSYRNRFPHELSGGQKQRVGIARALSLSPELLVADEPTSALDVSVQATVLELLKGLQRELNFACLFISHDLAVVDIMADRIAVMHHGKIVETGSRDQILRSPKDPYTQRLIAAIPVPDPEQQRERRELRRTVLKATDDVA